MKCPRCYFEIKPETAVCPKCKHNLKQADLRKQIIFVVGGIVLFAVVVLIMLNALHIATYDGLGF